LKICSSIPRHRLEGNHIEGDIAQDFGVYIRISWELMPIASIFVKTKGLNFDKRKFRDQSLMEIYRVPKNKSWYIL
jgi:hypothetical protein